MDVTALAARAFGASTYDPISLRVGGQALPARRFREASARAAGARDEGAPVPDGADAVAMAEVCEQRGDSVAISEPVAPHKHVGAVGEDVRKGETLLRAGRVLRAQTQGARGDRRGGAAVRAPAARAARDHGRRAAAAWKPPDRRPESSTATR